MNRCQVDHAFTMVSEEFIVFGEPTIGTQPSERALHHPAPGDDFKALEVIAAQSNIDDDLLELLGSPFNELATIAAIGPQPLQTFEQNFRQRLEQPDGF